MLESVCPSALSPICNFQSIYEAVDDFPLRNVGTLTRIDPFTKKARVSDAICQAPA